MITMQHTAIYFLALADARKNNPEQMMEEFSSEIPFVLLPDAIRAYSGPRQITHFEETPDGADISWMKFPDEKTLKELTRENIKEKVAFYMAEGYPKCDIGETTNLRAFERKNLGHHHYHSLRVHLFQDCVLDAFLRTELINHEQRFKNQFQVRHNKSIVLDGKQLRDQIARFEHIGFIKLAGIVYERTGVLLDRAWFDTNVYPALSKAYPRDLADNTYRYMMLDDETDQRLMAYQFDITDEDRSAVPMSFDLEHDLESLIAEGYYYTRHEL